jgi:hypothetical protein
MMDAVAHFQKPCANEWLVDAWRADETSRAAAQGSLILSDAR